MPSIDACKAAVLVDGTCTLAPANEGASCTKQITDGVCISGVCTCQPGCGLDCVDLATNAAHCGACGHDCAGGACAGSVCQPVTIATEPLAGRFEQLVVDATHIYWTGDAKVRKAPITGGAVTILAAAQPNARAIAVDATNVYWGNQFVSGGSVNSVPLGGGPVTALATGVVPTRIAIDGASVYFLEVGDQTRIRKVPIGGGAVATVHANSATRARDLATDGIEIYFTNAHTAGQSIGRVPVGGGASTSSTVPNLPDRLVMDATTVYWLNTSQNTVNAVPKAGGANTVLATVSMPRGLTVDENFVYVVATGANQGIVRVPIGGGAPVTLFAGAMGGGGIANGAHRIYWAGATAVMSLAK